MHNISKNILLKLSYTGDGYHGFAYQPALPTVEYYLFYSMIRSRFIRIDPSSITDKPFTFSKDILDAVSVMKYHKCGRTDSGVSAAAQYISILLPCASSGEGYPYDTILNQYLPDKIRVIGWMGVDGSFSARFSCTSREYEYYFARGSRDIERMHQASRMLIGTHWFGRLSKKEKESSKIKRYEKKQKTSPDSITAEESVRTVDSISFEKVSADAETGIEIYLMRIRAKSFLHNQVRKIFSLLSMIGEGSEIRIENILNRNEKQEKEIKLSDPGPLVLAKCTFDKIDLSQMASTDRHKRLSKIAEDAFVSSRVRERVAKEFAYGFI